MSRQRPIQFFDKGGPPYFFPKTQEIGGHPGFIISYLTADADRPDSLSCTPPACLNVPAEGGARK